jgi:hypothetical protein
MADGGRYGAAHQEFGARHRSPDGHSRLDAIAPDDAPGGNILGATSKESNHHLKGALVEAANTVAAHQTKWTEKYPHAVGLYQRVKETTKLSGTAKVAVARHLAEATWWILTRKQDYREPTSARVTLLDLGPITGKRDCRSRLERAAYANATPVTKECSR